MNRKLQIILWMAMVIAVASACPAETSPPITGAPAEAEAKKDWHFEVGGSYSTLNNSNGPWKAIDTKLMYSGLKLITPFASIASLSRKEGSQRVYGVGSYVYVNSRFYMIAGVSGAPVDDPNAVLYPRLRMDLMGLVQAPGVDGLVLTTGVTDFSSPGGGGDIIAVGFMYYYQKAIFSGSLNYNIARPGGVTSLSGQVGLMYGAQGSYFVAGGVATGRVAYQLGTDTPLDVRYDSRSANVSYQHWIGKNWGLISRYDYVDNVGFYKLNGLTLKYFVDF